MVRLETPNKELEMNGRNSGTPTSLGSSNRGRRPPGLASTPLPPNSRVTNAPYQRPSSGAAQSERLDVLLNEIRRGLEEQKKVKEDVRRIGLAMNRLEDRIKHLGDQFKLHSEQSFSVDNSQYKVKLF